MCMFALFISSKAAVHAGIMMCVLLSNFGVKISSWCRLGFWREKIESQRGKERNKDFNLWKLMTIYLCEGYVGDAAAITIVNVCAQQA